MTKQLATLFDLPDAESKAETQSDSTQIELAGAIDRATTNLDRIESALPQVRGLDLGDQELDNLSDLAVESFKDLSDLALQVDSRHAGEILGVASTMLGHAITAKTAKLNKKIKVVELQLKKAMLDQKTAEKSEALDAIPVGEGRLLDRNELLRALSAKTTTE